MHGKEYDHKQEARRLRKHTYPEGRQRMAESPATVQRRAGTAWITGAELRVGKTGQQRNYGRGYERNPETRTANRSDLADERIDPRTQDVAYRIGRQCWQLERGRQTRSAGSS